MSAFTFTDKFSFPPDIDALSVPNPDNKVCVISLIGKSAYHTNASKASPLNHILDRDVFKCIPESVEDSINKGDVECFYDAESQVIYLHLRSLSDVHRVAALCQRLVSEKSSKDFFFIWQKEEYRVAKTLLWMFGVSHLLLLSHPGSSFDISFVRLFRTLDNIRLKLQHSVSDQLHGLPISKDWSYNGRPCSPRVLFVFESNPLDISVEDSELGLKSRSPKGSPIKRLQHAMEDQIYRILRKSRVITNISNNSLFAVPANQEFVYIHTERSEVVDPVAYYLEQLRQNSTIVKDSVNVRETDSPRSRSYQSNRKVNQGNGPSESRSSSTTARSKGGNSFKEFLWQHIEMALGRGFDDNVGRNPVPSLFENVSAQTWFVVASKLYQFYFGDVIDGKAQAHLNTLKSLLETDIRFSENRCNKVLPLAEAAYQENLPTHYVTNFHLSKLAQAQRVFHQFARGPACEKYLKQLEQSCEKFWRNGRQLCEEVSILSNHCVNPLHRLPDDPETDANCHLPIMPHSSQLKTKASCNCGRKQADKEDPFDHKYANFDFYNSLEPTCCGELEHLDLLVFKPSTSDVKASQIGRVPSMEERGENTTQKDTLKHDIVTGMGSLSLALSLGQSGGSEYLPHHDHHSVISTTEHYTSHQSDHGPETDEHEEGSDGPIEAGHSVDVVEEEDEDQLEEEEHSPDKEEGSGHKQEETEALKQEEEPHKQEVGSPKQEVDMMPSSPKQDLSSQRIEPEIMINSQKADVEIPHKDEVPLEKSVLKKVVELDEAGTMRQHSTTEYLYGMIHSESPPHLLPRFPSWNICCLGKSTMYNHSAGLDLPGFLHGSNFLLPWDITVKAEKDKWPSIGETTSRKGKQKKSSKEVGEVNLRIYLGDEYECPRGHRFFCSGPEKVIKVSSSSTVKDNATKLVSLDMPLYCPCPQCRSTKGYVAQLMRLYVCTPEGPVTVTLDPHIQPSAPPCPVFSLGTENPVELPAGSVWVVRMPHIYMGDHGPYTMPTDSQHLQFCRMLKGVFSYRDLNKNP
ncbi:nonsense-mediated mRNA decay factor SMG8-like isoform X1 [Crassostrea angulata]|uniref:nonsense-mediated mRNA decay factor SMG8-like isoform X1 n=1 Tax=Magallana angulata TaxID=2784310 RepID=UPI0022B11569|nr:nonsense-mediated mRNA decay factor SMG8-like isoform X1 [Crassostrea angulata]